MVIVSLCIPRQPHVQRARSVAWGSLRESLFHFGLWAENHSFIVFHVEASRVQHCVARRREDLDTTLDSDMSPHAVLSLSRATQCSAPLTMSAYRLRPSMTRAAPVHFVTRL